MAVATEITTTSQDITDDFQLQITGVSTEPVQLLMAAGAAGSEWVEVAKYHENGWYFVKNSNSSGALTNAFKKGTASGTAKFTQQ